MNLLKALVTVSGLTLVSRILGFVRDVIIARMFGAGLATDAFFVAFKIPNLLRRLFAEGAFAQAFVPILAEYRNRRGEDATRDLVSKVATLLTLALTLVSIAGVIAAPLLVQLIAPGFAQAGTKFELTVAMLRVTFPYILFISLVALASGVLNTWSRFAIPAITPALLNIAFIVGATGFASYFDPPIAVLPWAVLAGGALQLAFQLPALQRLGMLPRVRSPFRDEGVMRVLKLMAPAVFGVSVAQVSLVLNNVFASYLVTGSVSWLYYADRLMEFPTALLGVALGTILLPSLAKSHADRDGAEFSKLLDWGLRMTLLLALPSAVALAMLATPLVSTLFQHGAFGPHDVAMTARALIAYAFGLVALILVKVLAPGFYSRQNVTTPVKIAVLTLVITQLCNLALVQPLAHAGLAAAIGVGAWFNAGMLFHKLRAHAIYQPQPGWAGFAWRLGVAVLCMALVLWLVARPVQWWVSANWQMRGAWLTLMVLAGAVSYFAALGMLGFRPRDFSRRVAVVSEPPRE